MSSIVGIDGCKVGWFAVWENQHGEIDGLIFPQLVDIAERFSNQSDLIFGIDMPVVLAETYRRDADMLARQLLGKKASSVFNAPSLEVLGHSDYRQAALDSKKRFGKSITLQSWYLFPKIREVQSLLSVYTDNLFEIHPELSFKAMNDGHIVLQSKKSPEGLAIRGKLIAQFFEGFNFDAIRKKYAKKELADDDILDAIAVLWSAKRISVKQAQYIPLVAEKPKMQIAF